VTSSGIIIPGIAQQKQDQGRVIAVGEGKLVEKRSKGRLKTKVKKEEKTFVKTTLKPGDDILYEQYSTREIELDGVSYLMVREEDVLGKLA
jgi:chaperonin GroES